MLTVLNDTHIGAVRTAGTTPATQLKLKKHILDAFKSLLPANDLLINGDLFDTGNVAIADVLATFEILSDWLHDNPCCKLYNAAGNHDLNRTSNVLSSFQFLGRLLYRQFPARYIHIEEPMMTPYGYVIPHLRNQDVFDLALAGVPACDYVFLHANYNNGFAAESDQSLNVSKEQADAMPCKHLIFGHEHHARNLGKVLVPGNQIASSVSDWLSPSDKRFIVIDKEVTFVRAAVRSTEFTELDWRKLETTEHQFVRVSGTAKPDEISGAITLLNRFRAASPALVVTNAIEVESDDSAAEAFSSSLESVQAFSILDALRKVMTPEEMKILEKLAC